MRADENWQLIANLIINRHSLLSRERKSIGVHVYDDRNKIQQKKKIVKVAKSCC